MPADDCEALAGGDQLCSIAGAPLSSLADRSQRARRRDAGRRARRPRSRLAAFVESQLRARPRPQSSRRGLHQPPVALPALRTHLGARDVLRGDDRERWTTRRLGGAGRRRAGRLVGRERLRQPVSRSAGRLARARLQRLRMDAGLLRLPHRCREWARDTLEAHAADPRRRYAFETLDAAATARSECGTPRNGS